MPLVNKKHLRQTSTSRARIDQGYRRRTGGRLLRVDSANRSPESYQFDQESLERLSQDRKLRTSEIHHPNDFYGQASVIKYFTGLPQWYAIKGVLEHAPVLHDQMWSLDRDKLLPLNLSTSRARSEVVQSCSGRPAIPIGFGYHYARQLVDRFYSNPSQPIARQGTLVFPFKSTHYIDTDFDHADYANRLDRLPDEMKPITVCIYWKDFLRGAHADYQKKGFGLVTAGHMFDRLFLLRLHDICRRFKFAVSNEFGTQLFTSVVSGCRFFYVSSSSISRKLKPEQQSEYVRDDPGFQDVRMESMRLFAEPVEETTPEQQQFVDRIMGTDCVRTAEELRSILWRAELDDKFHSLKLEGDTGIVTRIPACWRRGLSRGKRLRRSIVKRLPFGRRQVN